MTDLERRAFFLKGSRKVTEAAIDQIGTHVRNRAKHWIRPPFALDELEFLTTCSRCGECIDACPHQVIFPLASRLGATVVGTPALDLVNKGCHLCADWPCVAACEPRALRRPSRTEEIESDSSRLAPVIAIANINQQFCLAYLGPECGACSSSCPVPRALVWNAEKPEIDLEFCVGCGLCRDACIVDPKAIEISSLYKESEINAEGNETMP